MHGSPNPRPAHSPRSLLVLLFVCGVILRGAINAPAQNESHKPARWTPEVMISYHRLLETAMSPDGKWVAYTVSMPIMAGEKSEYRTHIFMASVEGKSSFPFTQGDKSCTNPQWSPDGNWLAFLSARGGEKNNIWLIRALGGEAEKLTEAKSGVNNFKWSPDGERLAYTMNDSVTEEEEKNNKEKKDALVVDENFKYAHLYVIPIAKDAKGERPVQRLTRGEFHVGNFDWSPDGKWLAFDHQVTPRVNDWPTTTISLAPADSGASKPFFTKPFAVNPRFSPGWPMAGL